MKELKIICTDKDSGNSITQCLALSDAIAEKLVDEVDKYCGGEIAVDSTMFDLLTGCRYLVKLLGWKKVPDFEIIPEEWMMNDEYRNKYS